MHQLEGRVVLVAGGGSGIGAATAAAVARVGARVVVGDLKRDNAASVAERIGPQATGHALDVSSEESWAELVNDVVVRYGRLDGLVNSAGVSTGHGLLETSAEEMRWVMSVNTIGPFLGIKAVVGPMREAGGGAIVNISSCGALTGLRSNISYATSKWGVRGLTKGLVHELGGYGIRINAVFPGYVNTPLSRPEWSDADLSEAQTSDAAVALGRTGRPEEIADAVRFLLTDESSYCTGGEFTIDGGLTSVLPTRGD